MQNQATRAAVIAEARTWLNTRYHHQARIKGVGVDCATLLLAVYEACGLIPAVDVGNYPSDWHLHHNEEQYMGWLTRLAHEVETPKSGDVALWKFGRCFSHGAIVSDPQSGEIIHSYIRLGCVIGNMNDALLRSRHVKFYSLFND